jgi:hypothetical protein
MDFFLEVMYLLRSLGVALDGQALMSVVLKTTAPSSFLKKHN